MILRLKPITIKIKHKFTFLQAFVCLMFINLSAKAQSTFTPTTTPYYGTVSYPFWGIYNKTPIAEIIATKWIEKDNVILDLDYINFINKKIC